MPRFRKKPVVIEAIQFDGRNASVIGAFVGAGMSFRESLDDGEQSDLIIHTLEGEMRASKGAFIIKGIADEFYPCKESIFYETYEEVTD